MCGIFAGFTRLRISPPDISLDEMSVLGFHVPTVQEASHGYIADPKRR